MMKKGWRDVVLKVREAHLTTVLAVRVARLVAFKPYSQLIPQTRHPSSLSSDDRSTSTPAKLKSWSYATSPMDKSQAAALHRVTLQA